MTTTTNVRVRAQANGGKYIGPAVTNGPILSVLAGGKPLIPSVPIPHAASGAVVTKQDATSSPYTIVVQPPDVKSNFYPPPGTYWLDPPADGDADVIVALPLSAPTEVEFKVEAFAPQPVCSSVTQLIQPGGAYTGQPGVVVSVPGLYVPQFTVQPHPAAATITATVQMMCGCPITQQPATSKPTVEWYWPSNEFEVTAVLVPIGSIQPPVFVPLPCVGTNQFTANTPVLWRGNYLCILSAVQPSTGNRGSASTHVTIG